MSFRVTKVTFIALHMKGLLIAMCYNLTFKIVKLRFVLYGRAQFIKGSEKSTTSFLHYCVYISMQCTKNIFILFITIINRVIK